MKELHAICDAFEALGMRVVLVDDGLFEVPAVEHAALTIVKVNDARAAAFNEDNSRSFGDVHVQDGVLYQEIHASLLPSLVHELGHALLARNRLLARNWYPFDRTLQRMVRRRALKRIEDPSRLTVEGRVEHLACCAAWVAMKFLGFDEDVIKDCLDYTWSHDVKTSRLRYVERLMYRRLYEAFMSYQTPTA